MANAKVSLLRYVKTSKGWRRCRVEEESTRKGRGWTTDWDDPKSYGPDVEALRDYQLKWYQGKNAKYACAGSDLREATIQRDKPASLLAAESAAEEAGVSLVEPDPTRKTLQLLKSEFIKQKEDVGRDRETIFTVSRILPHSSCCSRMRRKRRIVVSSGAAARPKSTPAKWRSTGDS